MHMPKPEIHFTEEPLRWICNEAFYGVKSLSPGLYEIDTYDRPLAYFLGAGGGVVAAEIGKNVIVPLAHALGSSVSLDEVVSHCLTFTLAAAVMPFVIARKKTIEWIREHSTYASGVAGVMSGAVGTAVYELSQNL